MSIARSKGIYWAGQAGSEGDGREHAEVQDGLAEGPSPSKKTAAGHLGAAPAAASAHASPEQREYWPGPLLGTVGQAGGQGGEVDGGKGVVVWFLSGFFCWFEEMEVFSWRRLTYRLPKNCDFHPSVSFPVSHSRSPSRSEIRGGLAELAHRPLHRSVGQTPLAAGLGLCTPKKKDILPPVVVGTQHVTICI